MAIHRGWIALVRITESRNDKLWFEDDDNVVGKMLNGFVQSDFAFLDRVLRASKDFGNFTDQ